MFRLMSPVASSAVPEMLSAHLLTTQIGTLLARSGSGAPNVAPVGVPSPVVALKSQTVSLPELQFDRQPSIRPFGTRMKLCELPVQPLSRSVPVVPIVNVSSWGPPSRFTGQFPWIRGQPASDGFGLQTRISVSTSFVGRADIDSPFSLSF